MEVYIRTGVDEDLATDIARGLNTGMQVAAKSIYNIDGVFDWLKDEIKGKPYDEMIAWRESDNKEYDVRDLIGVLELFNVFDFPNEVSKHPWSMSVMGILRQLPRDTCDPKPCVRIERRVGDAIEYEVVIANPMQVISCIHIG